MVQAAAVNIPSLSAGSFATVYNLFSLAIACLLFTSLYLVVSQRQVAKQYRNAVRTVQRVRDRMRVLGSPMHGSVAP